MVYTVGEMLVDMIPDANGHFEPCPGGAPANVAAAVAKLGGSSSFIGMLGNDSFGDMLYKTLDESGVDISMVGRTEAKTSLAFVILDGGERSFEFYRNPGADTLYPPEKLPENFLSFGDTVHFGSVSLMPSQTRDTHYKILRQARRRHAVISFDVNLRHNLWNDDIALKKAVNEALPFADIVKMSEEEYEFITGFPNSEAAAKSILEKSAEVVIISLGNKGAEIYLKNGNKITKPAMNTVVADTVGAGDALMGAILYSVDGSGENDLKNLNWDMILDFAVAVAGISVSRKGGIASLPTFKEVMDIYR